MVSEKVKESEAALFRFNEIIRSLQKKKSHNWPHFIEKTVTSKWVGMVIFFKHSVKWTINTILWLFQEVFMIVGQLILVPKLLKIFLYNSAWGTFLYKQCHYRTSTWKKLSKVPQSKISRWFQRTAFLILLLTFTTRVINPHLWTSWHLTGKISSIPGTFLVKVNGEVDNVGNTLMHWMYSGWLIWIKKEFFQTFKAVIAVLCPLKLVAATGLLKF